MTTSLIQTWIQTLRIPWTVWTSRYEPQMVRPERWYYPHHFISLDDEDPRIRRLRRVQLKKWIECLTECFSQEKVSTLSLCLLRRKMLFSGKGSSSKPCQRTIEILIAG